MQEDRKKKIESLKERVRASDYQVDPRAVADAIIRRRVHLALLASPEPQNGCSNPDSSASESTNLTVAGPALTEPINVTSALGSRRARRLRRLRLALGGTQKQIS